jgi:hypothetical protein
MYPTCHRNTALQVRPAVVVVAVTAGVAGATVADSVVEDVAVSSTAAAAVLLSSW